MLMLMMLAVQVGMMLCDCDLAYRSLEVSGDRCQLCCFDFTARACRNARKHYAVSDAAGRPIPRSGLACGRGKTCDRFGACVKAAASPLASSLLLTLILLLLAS